MLQNILILLSLPFLTASLNSQPYNCTNPESNTCTFYKACLEVHYHCGPPGYPLAYGYKICERFLAHKAELTREGQKWMFTVMLCLQKRLVPLVDGSMEDISCDELRHYAYSTHPGCYVATGFCELGLKDWVATVRILELRNIFGSWDSFKDVIATVGSCLGFRMVSAYSSNDMTERFKAMSLAVYLLANTHAVDGILWINSIQVLDSDDVDKLCLH